jgi:hypothetical protein
VQRVACGSHGSGRAWPCGDPLGSKLMCRDVALAMRASPYLCASDAQRAAPRRRTVEAMAGRVTSARGKPRSHIRRRTEFPNEQTLRHPAGVP